MANQKISALTDGSPILDTDNLVVQRGATNVKTNIASKMSISVYDPGSISADAFAATISDFNTQVSSIADMLTSVYDPTNVNADAFARANHTGTQLAATISDFTAAARIALGSNGLEALTTSIVDQLENMGVITVSGIQWGYVGNMDQQVSIGYNVTWGICAATTFFGDLYRLTTSDSITMNIQSNSVLTAQRAMFIEITDADTTLDLNATTIALNQSLETDDDVRFAKASINTTTENALLNIGDGSLVDSTVKSQMSAGGARAYYGSNRSDGVLGALFGWDTTYGTTVRSVNSADSISLVVDNSDVVAQFNPNGQHTVGSSTIQGITTFDFSLGGTTSEITLTTPGGNPGFDIRSGGQRWNLDGNITRFEISANGTTGLRVFPNESITVGGRTQILLPGAVSCSVLGVEDSVSAPSTLSGVSQIYVDTADGNLKVKFGSGTVKTLATDP